MKIRNSTITPNAVLIGIKRQAVLWLAHRLASKFDANLRYYVKYFSPDNVAQARAVARMEMAWKYCGCWHSADRWERSLFYNTFSASIEKAYSYRRDWYKWLGQSRCVRLNAGPLHPLP